MLELNCTYVGKQPEPPLTHEIGRDWTTEGTDFYHYVMKNVSDQTIEFQTAELRLEEVRNGRIFKRLSVSEIVDELGQSVLSPGDSVGRRNSWVWGLNGQSRTLHKVYRGRQGDRPVKVDVVLVYRP